MSTGFFNDDPQVTRVEKTVKRTFIAIAIFWIFSTLLSLGLLGGIVYVACHFLAKVW